MSAHSSANAVHCEAQPTSVLLEALLENSIFAVLDTCDDKRVLDRIRQLGDKAVCLFGGRSKEDFYAIAPYLVKVDNELATWMLVELADSPWGFLALTPPDCDLETMRRHFRKFLLVHGTDGHELYFRFYDPRVLKTFLQNASPDEAESFFGPISRIGILSSSPQKACEFYFTR